MRESFRHVTIRNHCVRSLNCLKQDGVNTLSEFIAKNFTRRDLMQIRNFGKKSIDWMLEELKTKAGVEIE